MILTYFLFFFFFQAEDGIRDKLVTGVQTCALPIYRPVVGDHIRGRGRLSVADPGRRIVRRPARPSSADGPQDLHRSEAGSRQAGRSEERRVGKECRARWSPYQ